MVPMLLDPRIINPKVKNDLLGAEKCYRAAIEADPKDKDARRRLAKVMNSEEHY